MSSGEGRQNGRSNLRETLSLAAVLALSLSGADVLAAQDNWQTCLRQGDLERANGNLSKAEACFKQAIEKAKQSSGSAEQMAECRNKLANTLALEGRTDDAESLYQQSLSELERTYGKKSPKIATTLLALGSFLEAEGDHQLAITLYQRAMDLNEAPYGRISPAVADTVHYQKIPLESIDVKPFEPAAAAPPQQAALTASVQMLNGLTAAKDLLSKESNSNDDLLGDFQKEIMGRQLSDTKRTPKAAAWDSISDRSTD